jgi:hypothetical protein
MQDNLSIYNIYFRIEAGYNGGCMSREQHERFYTEIRRLFTKAGFRIEDRDVGCPDLILGKTRLYCHPESLSGPTEERHIALVEEILRKGVSFRYERTDKYERLYDFTPEEELEYYRRTNAATVERVFLDAFHTRRSDHYKYRNEILELLVRRYMVHTVRCPTGTCFDSPCNRYVREMYDSLRRRGLLIQVERKNDAGSVLYYCRSANATERRALGYYD